MDLRQNEKINEACKKMYTKNEIDEVKKLSMDYRALGNIALSDHFFHIYLKYTAFTVEVFGLPIGNN